MQSYQPRKTALIIDSDSRIRDLVAVALSKEGCLIQVAKTPVIATKIIDEQGPDLVFLDASTPGFWLPQFNDRLVSKNPLACLILMLRPTVRPPSNLNGHSRFLKKPFGSSDVMKIIKTCSNN